MGLGESSLVWLVCCQNFCIYVAFKSVKLNIQTNAVQKGSVKVSGPTSAKSRINLIVR